MDKTVSADDSISIIRSIYIAPLILEIIHRTTKLGFVAVARVTPDSWIACEVLDMINFGLKAGGGLEVESTICHEIRQSRVAVVIDDVPSDDVFCNHHTPARYGFKSYISVPIIVQDNSFFGTLCAIDPNPAILKDTVIVKLFNAYAELIAFLIDSRTLLPTNKFERLKERCSMALRAHLLTFTGVILEGTNNKLNHSNAELNTAIEDAIEGLNKLIVTLKSD